MNYYFPAIALRHILIVSALFFVMIKPVYAESSGKTKTFYAGFAAGATYSESPSDFDMNSRDSGFRLLFGRRLSSNFALEASFSSLGQYSTDDESFKESFNALTLSLAGIFPLRDYGVELDAHIGYGLIAWRREMNNSFFNIELSDSGDTILASLGVKLDPAFVDNVSMRLGYDYYYYETSNAFTEEDGRSHNLRMLSLNMSFYFR